LLVLDDIVCSVETKLSLMLVQTVLHSFSCYLILKLQV